VAKLHGALAVLVGSEAYGCIPKEGIEDASEEDSCSFTVRTMEFGDALALALALAQVKDD